MRLVVVAILAVAGCAVFLVTGRAAPVPKEPEAASGWEYRAVAFGTDEKEGTTKLNALARGGWEYVGPLGNGLVAFKKAVRSASDLELDKFQGTWTLISREEAGQVTRAEGDTITFHVTGDKWAWKENGVVIQQGTLKLTDLSKNPKQFEYTAGDGAVGYSVYQFDRDGFKYCSTGSPNTRPTDFTTKDGDGRYCCVWKRAKR